MKVIEEEINSFIITSFLLLGAVLLLPLSSAVSEGASCGYQSNGGPFCDSGLSCEYFQCVKDTSAVKIDNYRCDSDRGWYLIGSYYNEAPNPTCSYSQAVAGYSVYIYSDPIIGSINYVCASRPPNDCYSGDVSYSHITEVYYCNHLEGNGYWSFYGYADSDSSPRDSTDVNNFVCSDENDKAWVYGGSDNAWDWLAGNPDYVCARSSPECAVGHDSPDGTAGPSIFGMSILTILFLLVVVVIILKIVGVF